MVHFIIKISNKKDSLEFNNLKTNYKKKIDHHTKPLNVFPRIVLRKSVFLVCSNQLSPCKFRFGVVVYRVFQRTDQSKSLLKYKNNFKDQ